MYFPTPADIIQVSLTLAEVGGLPGILIDEILEEAEYWARITTTLDVSSDEEEDYIATGAHREHILILRSKPICSAAADGVLEITTSSDTAESSIQAAKPGFTFNFIKLMQNLNPFGAGNDPMPIATRSVAPVREPRDYHPVRRITWKLFSHDQGWGGDGGDTYERSYTGFRGNVLRYVPFQTTTSQDARPQRSDWREEAEFWQLSSQIYLSAWENIQSNVEGAMKDNAGQLFQDNATTTKEEEEIGQYVEGDSDELRVWPKGNWLFEKTHVQINRRAVGEYMEHIVVWDTRDSIMPEDPEATDGLVKKGRGVQTGAGRQVRALCRGDVVELHSYAFFRGWRNHVKNAQVVIEFAI